MDLGELLNDAAIRRNLIATGILLLAAVILRILAQRAIVRAQMASEQVRLRWSVVARNVSVGLFLLGGVIIWASEIRSVAISVVVLAGAIVLATKELILCISGAVLRAGSGAFSVGDRIEMGGVRGDVIDTNLLSTTLLEVGLGHQRTGRAVTVPNSVLLSGTVANDTFMEEYVVHVVSVPIDPRATDWERAERALLEAGREASKDYTAPARKFMDGLAKQHGLPLLSVEPRVLLSFARPEELRLLLRVPAPARERGRVEQIAIRGYLARMAEPPPS